MNIRASGVNEGVRHVSSNFWFSDQLRDLIKNNSRDLIVHDTYHISTLMSFVGLLGYFLSSLAEYTLHEVGDYLFLILPYIFSVCHLAHAYLMND